MKINGKELNTLSESSIVFELLGLEPHFFGPHAEGIITAERLVVKSVMGKADQIIFNYVEHRLKDHSMFLKRVETHDGYEYWFSLPEEYVVALRQYTFYHKPQYQSKRSLVQRLLGKLW